jgi:long-chain acyl-CoA synthetase
MRTVIELLHEGALTYGDMPYLGEKTGETYTTTSFIEADRLSLAFAAALVLHGFQKGDNIAILSEGRTSWVISEFGILKAGCVSVPLSTKLSPDEILFRLDHSESKAILVSENNYQKVAEVLPLARKKPLVVCISERTETMKDPSILFYSDLLAEGQKGLDTGPAPKAPTVDNPTKIARPLAWVMRETEKAVREDDTVTISYTSGTTGNPKGIMLTHLNYWHNTHDSAEIVEVKKGWKSLIMLPLDHSFAHTVGIYIFLYKGMCMYFVDAQGGPMAALRNLPKNLVEVNPDLLLTVPALSGNFMKKMKQGVAAKGAFINGIFERGVAAGIARAGNGYQKPPLGVRIRNYFPWALANALIFPKLRLIFGKDIKFCSGGGALLEIKQQEFFNAIGVPVYQGYGLTENAPIICSNSVKKHKFGTSGVIIPTLQVRIMKDAETECRDGEIGQIVTRGDSVMKGYYKNPEATAETLKDGWLWSGDLGYKDADGFLVVTGREKALLIAADGEKYSPETIEEAVINTSKYINQIMAYNEQNKFTSALVTINAEALKADLKGNSDPDAAIDLILDDISTFKAHADYRNIPAQWIPSSFAVIPEAFDEKNGLVNSTMKLVRHKVRAFYQGRIDEIYGQGTADAHTEGNRQTISALIG